MNKSLQKPSYDQQLRTPQWQRRRLKELDRAGFKCQCCGDGSKELQVHHLKYQGDHPAFVPDGYLEVLCIDCHQWREHWNAIFGRKLCSTKYCRLQVENGLRELASRDKEGDIDFADGSALSDILQNWLRTIIGDCPRESAADIFCRHLGKFIEKNRARELAALNEQRALRAKEEVTKQV